MPNFALFNLAKRVMKFFTLEEITDKYIGGMGTPERKAFESDVKAALVGLEECEIKI